MRNEEKIETMNIIGVELKTTNVNGKAFEEIPPFWQKFYQEGIVEKIPGKISDAVYAVYTNFENEGKNNNGVYSLIIGCSVGDLDSIPSGLVSTIIPVSKYTVFESETGYPEKVGETWQKIWKLSEEDKKFDKKRSYLVDFEQYQSSGEIKIYIGMKNNG